MERGPDVELRSHVRGDQRRQRVLALDTDVEQVHAEADGHSDTGDVERCRPVEGVDEGLQPGAVLGHGGVGAPRIGADREQYERGDDKREADGGDRRRCGQEQLTSLHSRSPIAAPVMWLPRSRGVTDEGSS